MLNFWEIQLNFVALDAQAEGVPRIALNFHELHLNFPSKINKKAEKHKEKHTLTILKNSIEFQGNSIEFSTNSIEFLRNSIEFLRNSIEFLTL